MNVRTPELMRQLIAAALLSAIAVMALVAAAGHAGAADMPAAAYAERVHGVQVAACGPAGETAILFDHRGYPTIPARTPYFYCLTGTTLLPGQIPPPPDYCCH